MNVRQANKRARALFGDGVLCETIRTGQTYRRELTIKAGGRLGTVDSVVLHFPANIPWEHVFDLAQGILGTSSPEGT